MPKPIQSSKGRLKKPLPEELALIQHQHPEALVELWAMNEPLANRSFPSLDEVEQVQAERCRWMQSQSYLIRDYIKSVYVLSIEKGQRRSTNVH